MKFKHFLVPVLAIVGCGALRAQSADTTPSPSPEYGYHHHQGRHHHAWIWKKLNLTDAQKSQIKSVRQALKGEIRPALAAVLKAKLQLHQDIDTNSVNPNDVSALVTAESQLATVRAKEFAQIKTVFTQEQQTTLNNFKQERATRMQNLITKLSQPST
jgi:Spy/CpxP family protein refolding chaperone